MSEKLRNQILQLAPTYTEESTAEVFFGRHKWLVHYRRGQVEIYYWDRRLQEYYRVWCGHWKQKPEWTLTGRFNIRPQPGKDFTPVSRDRVNELVLYVEEILLQEFTK